MLNTVAHRRHGGERRLGGETGIDGIVTGMRVDTPLGEVPVEELVVGDPVLVAGGRVRRITWIGRVELLPDDPARYARLRPVRLAAGALGPGCPRRDLLVGPEQPVRLDDEGRPVLAVVRLLANMASIRRAPVNVPVTFVQIALAEPACLLVEGAALRSVDAPADVVPVDDPAMPEAIGPGPALARASAALDRLAGQMPRPLRGYAEIDGTAVVGWALDRADPDRPVALELLCDGAVAAQAVADRPRNDLLQMAGVPGCGFSLALPEGDTGGRLHEIVVRRAGDGAELFATMAVLGSAGGPEASRLEEVLAAIDRVRARLAA